MRMIRPLRLALALSAAALAAAAPAASAADGTMTWGVHVSLTPAFFDPVDATGTALPLMVYYAVHDALVRPLPGTRMGAALAQSWSQSADGLSYPLRVRFRLKQPWPNFMTFYGTPATGAAWIVPKKYVERVGDEGFKRAPVGAGPCRLVSFNAAGIRVRLRLLERAAFLKQFADKTLKNVILAGSGAPGNAATGLEQYAVMGGLDAYGSYPEVDGLFNAQANEGNPRASRQILQKMQQIIHERVMFGPVIEYAYLVSIGPRVAVDGVNALPDDPYTAPYEDLRLLPR